MKLQFDSKQIHQQKAVDSIVNLFEGQGASSLETDIALTGGNRLIRNELAIANNLELSEEQILENLRKIQFGNNIELSTHLMDMNFSVEMETGTGKTYVYLKTIMELYRKYGFMKFVIVVPSIAIKEGTQKNLEITREHFNTLYNNVSYTYQTYDSKKPTMLRSFANANNISIMIINIDSFRKLLTDKDDEKKSNIIHRYNDKMGGRKPIDFLQACNPIVIIDEPQSVDNTSKAQEAIKTLNPLFTLRYSATHKNPYNLCYKLGPIEAFDQNLVKRIEVASANADINYNFPYIKLEKVDNKKGIQAQLSIFEKGKNGQKLTKVTVDQGSDLFELSGELEVYNNNYIVEGISCEKGNEFIEFANGKTLTLGETIGDMREELMRIQVYKTVEEHLEKEKRYREKGIKVLSLFFIDKVANYRWYDDKGEAQKGKFAQWFEESYKELTEKPKFEMFKVENIEAIHNGYFSADKKGKFKDTKGDTLDDTDTYSLIMKNKEQLLDITEPLRFIFSHSALREGWDNPNVFQICTLNETTSTMKKRQEIGRGLRLAVNQQGERIKLKDYNILTVVANENYETFVKTLQGEYEEDYGIKFGVVAKTAFSKISYETPEGKEEFLGVEESKVIWNELHDKEYIDSKGKIKDSFTPGILGFELKIDDKIAEKIGIPKAELVSQVISVMQNHQLETRIKPKANRKEIRLNKEIYMNPEFEKFWNQITGQTTYSVEYESSKLIEDSIKAIDNMEKVTKLKISYEKAGVKITTAGLKTNLLKNQNADYIEVKKLPDIIAYLQKETELTRDTLVKILTGTKRLEEFRLNPQLFMDLVAKAIKEVLNKVVMDGIKYEKVDEQSYEMRLSNVFEKEEIMAYIDKMVEVKNCVYNAIQFDSDIERIFAMELDQREDIEFFFKLPGKFKIETPVGNYNPDWAIVKRDDNDDRKLYLIRETKGGKDSSNLRETEKYKIDCGRKHFRALGIDDFAVVTKANEV